MSRLQKIIVPTVAVVVGLSIGLGIGQFRMNREQQVFQDRLKEANKKVAFIQKKTAEEKNEATTSLEQKCQSDLDKLANEKKALGGQLEKLKEQARNLEVKIKDTEELSAKAKKELQEAGQRYAQADQHNKDLEREIKKMTAEKTETAEKAERREKVEKAEQEKKEKALQAELQRTTRNLGGCEANNAKLVIIAGDAVNAYRNKGIGAAILEREPLTQVRKVELEQLTQQYREEIEQQKIKKK